LKPLAAWQQCQVAGGFLHFATAPRTSFRFRATISEYDVLKGAIAKPEDNVLLTVEELKPQLIALSESDRAELADFLLSTLDAEQDIAEAWKAELACRIADIKAGRAAGRSADEIFAELREQYP
jgi:putative addiction module component (TIGR02574 family)